MKKELKKSFFLQGIVFLFCTLWIGLAAATAQMYFWTDENGISHYSNVAPPDDNNDCYLIDEMLPLSSPPAQPPENATTVTVKKIFDGDSFIALGHGLEFSIRLVGIDAPETGRKNSRGQPFSQKAKKALADMIDKKQVKIVSHGKDHYNRQLAEVFADKTLVNLEMVTRGLAEVYPGKKPGTLETKKYYRAQQSARKARAGIWSLGKAYQSPSAWRKKNNP